jgi:CubicO group peptidase (beta-lactamase class C family)
LNLDQRLDATIEAALGSRIVGCVVLVKQNGRPVYERAAGFADREARRTMAANEIFRFASCTKPVVAAATLAMIEEGLLSLDDPVSRYLPFFTPASPDGAIRPILIRHLLTHTSGLTYDVPAGVSKGLDPGPLVPLEENLRRLARSPLAFAPGSRWEYGMSIDVLGGVIASINGDPSDLEAVVARYVTGPLGMSDTHFFVTDPARLAVPYGDSRPEPIRMAEPQAMHNDESDPDKVDYFSPTRIFQPDAPQSGGAGMAGTATDLMRFLEALRAGDLLRPATRAAAFANQIGNLVRENDPGQSFGFIGGVVEDPRASGWPVAGMVHWGGIWGNNWMIEPASGTTVVVMTNTMREGCNGPFRDEIHQAVFA